MLKVISLGAKSYLVEKKFCNSIVQKELKYN